MEKKRGATEEDTRPCAGGGRRGGDKGGTFLFVSMDGGDSSSFFLLFFFFVCFSAWCGREPPRGHHVRSMACIHHKEAAEAWPWACRKRSRWEKKENRAKKQKGPCEVPPPSPPPLPYTSRQQYPFFQEKAEEPDRIVGGGKRIPPTTTPPWQTAASRNPTANGRRYSRFCVWVYLFAVRRPHARSRRRVRCAF